MRLAAAIVGGAIFLSSPLLGVMPVHADPSRDDVVKLFGTFNVALKRVQDHFVEKPDDNGAIAGAIRGVLSEFPDTKEHAAAGSPPLNGSFPDQAHADLEDLYSLAGTILAHRRTDGDEERLVKAAIDGMLAALDPRSSYIDSKTFRDMLVSIPGFVGLGIDVTMEDGLAKVVAPIEDGPAAKAGVQAGDIISHLDDASVQGLSLNQVVEKMRGPVNTKARLKIARRGAPIEITIVRDHVLLRSVRGKVEDDVGVVRITQFDERTSDNLKKTIADISAQVPGDRLRGYVIDLRNNPGGLLDQAFLVAGAFLDHGEIVSIRGRAPEMNQRFDARPGDLTNGKSVIVLINGNSAAAAEIVAGALQDHHRATLVGTRSFGRGSVQTIIPLGSGKGALRLTTAYYFTPSGRSIQARGIAPDVEVLQDVAAEMKASQGQTKGESSLPGQPKAEGHEQAGSQSSVPPDPKDDKALGAALDLLRGVRTDPAFPPKTSRLPN
jgi:carboxyl-terminal processing protease